MKINAVERVDQAQQRAATAVEAPHLFLALARPVVDELNPTVAVTGENLERGERRVGAEGVEPAGDRKYAASSARSFGL